MAMELLITFVVFAVLNNVGINVIKLRLTLGA